MIANVVSIAGSDPSGGAGIQADLKTFSALGVYGMAVITALTAQNTRAVTAIHNVPPEFVAQQLETLFADCPVHAVKIGMLSNTAIIDTIYHCLQRHRPANLVIDPVMVAKSGDKLLDDSAIEALRQLITLATLITPNLPEAEVLLDQTITPTLEAVTEAAQTLRSRFNVPYVLLKGGHWGDNQCVDVFCSAAGCEYFSDIRIQTRNTHGTGCTLSSAIAACLTRSPALEAIQHAKNYIQHAIQASDLLQVGQGHGPVHHFYRWW